MWQELLHLHLPFSVPFLGSDIPIYGYGLMLVVGFLTGTGLGKYLARRVGLDGEIFVNAALLALVTGVLGARLSHVLENIGDYTRADRSALANFWDAVNLRSGGLTFYGGFIVATPCLLLYGWLKRVPLKLGMDIVAPCLMIGLAFGRIGCFFNGCCYGAPCDSVPWHVRFPYMSIPYEKEAGDGKLQVPKALLVPVAYPAGERPDLPASRPITAEELRSSSPSLLSTAAEQHSLWLHPAQLYSSFNAFLIAAILVAFFTLRPAPGRVFALMLLLDAPTRFLLEMLREEPKIFWGMTMAQATAVPLALVGIWLWRHGATRKSATRPLPVS